MITAAERQILATLLDDAEPATLVAQELDAEGIAPEDVFQGVKDLERAGLVRLLWFDPLSNGLVPLTANVAQAYASAIRAAKDWLTSDAGPPAENGMWLELTPSGRHVFDGPPAVREN